MNYLYFIIFLTVGIIMVRFSGWITDNTTRIEAAEKYLGPAGTYTFWKIVGIVAIVGAFWALFNS